MKRLILLIGLLLSAAPVFAAPSVVQCAAGAFTNPSTSATATFASPPTIGNRLIVSGSLFAAGSVASPGVTDNQSGNTYTVDVYKATGSNQFATYIASGSVAASSGTFTITVTYNSGAMGWEACEISTGAATVFLPDQSGSVDTSSGLTSTITATGANTNASAFVIACQLQAVAPPTTGYTNMWTDYVNFGTVCDYKSVSSAETSSAIYTGYGGLAYTVGAGVLETYRYATPGPQTRTAASCNSSAVDTQIGLSGAGDTVIIPSGTCIWTTTLSSTFPANFTIRGATTCTGSGNPATNDLACNDLTIIKDGINRSGFDAAMWNINAFAGFHMSGITFGWNGGTATSNGSLRFSFAGTSNRVDHIHFDNINALAFVHFDSPGTSGVFDHILLDAAHSDPFGGSGWRDYGDFSTQGDSDWNTATGLGSGVGIHFEDSRINHGSNDAIMGGRFIIRYSTIVNNGVQTHPTQNRARGSRAWEVYANKFYNAVAPDHGGFNVAYISSGTGVFWGNDASDGTYQHFITMHSDLVNGDASGYFQNQPANDASGNRWGYCGPGPQSDGTVSTVANGTGGTTVTRVGGDTFSTSWFSGQFIFLNGTRHTLAGTPSATVLTITDNIGTNPSMAYYAGSNWHGNADNTGYPCLDQPGQGVGDLLTGTDFSNTRNHTQMDADFSSPNAWPRQALEPIYIWGNSFNRYGGGTESQVIPYHYTLIENRDYYLDNTGCVGAGACTTGVGSGTSLPTTCTTGVGFWRTDLQKLYKCTSTNTFTLLYTPYTYPHPLNNDSAPTVTTTPSIRGRMRR